MYIQCPEKRCNSTFASNLGKYQMIFKILSLTDLALNFSESDN